MDDLWAALIPALITGTVIGALVTGFISLLKPWIDYWVTRATRRLDQKHERRVVVESVVERLRKLRVEHQAATRAGGSLSYDLILEASDLALLIHDQEFAKYLSVDIENIAGFGTLYEGQAELGNFEGDTSAGAQEARWNHLKQLVARASSYAVTGKWEKEWATEADKLAGDMAAAAAALER